MAKRDYDELFMAQAMELARAGIALASPNPCVGAVIVDERGRIVGRGTHTYEGRKHAEVLAIEQAGELARGNTLYINLEPCSHQGRTGPCADAVIAAGIGRVVVAMRDPNPLVSGRGLERIRAAGIDVLEGVMEGEAKKLNEAFAKYIQLRIPLVTLKSAMTLDGKIAGPPASVSDDAPGHSKASTTYITGEAARAHVQQLRHASDAIVVGIGTIIADDPMLTDRTGLPRRRPLMRVIIDSHLRIPLESKIVTTCDRDVIIFSSSAESSKRQALESRGVQVEEVPAGKDGRADVRYIFNRLGELDLISALVEGGGMINWACLAANFVDKVFLYFAPTLLGDGAVPFLSGGGFTQLCDAPRLHNISLHRFGDDFAVEGYIRDPYKDYPNVRVTVSATFRKL